MKFNSVVNWTKGYLTLKLNPNSIKPTSASLTINNKCNLTCNMCHFWRKNIGLYDLTKQKIEETANDLKSFGMKTLTITGGEPMLRKDYFEIVDMLYNMGFTLHGISNGHFINEEKAKKMWDYFEQITISVDGPNPEVYYKIRGTNGFEKVIYAIKLLKKYKPNGAILKINYTVQKYNYKYMTDMDVLANKLEVPVFYQCVEVDGAGNLRDEQLQDMNFNILKEQFEKLKDGKYVINTNSYIDHTLKVFYNKQNNKKNKMYFTCIAPQNNLQIDTDGYIYPCPVLNIKLGNIRKQSINEIYNSDKTQKVIKLIRNKKMERCKTCVQGCEIESALNNSLRHVVKTQIIKIIGE
jgi:radical SAM protein with 4Fe4S-binding SPASM domain